MTDTIAHNSAAPAFIQDPMDLVRTLVCMADKMAGMSAEQLAAYPSPLSEYSPLMLAARNACVERGFTAGGLAQDGSLAPALPTAPIGLEAELTKTQRMLVAACADLGMINEALGLDPNDGGADPILEAIEKLKDRTCL